MPFEPGRRVTGVRLGPGTLENPPVVLQAADPNTFNILTELTYRDHKQDVWRVPRRKNAATTDLASVPWPLWGLLAPYGHQLQPALLHDHRCDQAREASTKAEKWRLRRQGDHLFREALADNGVAPIRRNIFWTGVSFGRYLAFRKLGAAAIVVSVLISTALLWSAIAGFFGHEFIHINWNSNIRDHFDAWPPELLRTTCWAAFTLSTPLLFGRDYLAVAMANTITPIVTPTLIVTLATSILLWLVDLPATGIDHLRGKHTDLPTPMPYFQWAQRTLMSANPTPSANFETYLDD